MLQDASPVWFRPIKSSSLASSIAFSEAMSSKGISGPVRAACCTTSLPEPSFCSSHRVLVLSEPAGPSKSSAGQPRGLDRLCPRTYDNPIPAGGLGADSGECGAAAKLSRVRHRTHISFMLLHCCSILTRPKEKPCSGNSTSLSSTHA